ncbi:MAG TPA: hypothetical protein VLV78_04660 [Thermoanaerobaculia bacterium]|nr:hypothetical protein [Thermoanaerobaculia bacterium]
MGTSTRARAIHVPAMTGNHALMSPEIASVGVVCLTPRVWARLRQLVGQSRDGGKTWSTQYGLRYVRKK